MRCSLICTLAAWDWARSKFPSQNLKSCTTTAHPQLFSCSAWFVAFSVPHKQPCKTKQTYSIRIQKSKAGKPAERPFLSEEAQTPVCTVKNERFGWILTFCTFTLQPGRMKSASELPRKISASLDLVPDSLLKIVLAGTFLSKLPNTSSKLLLEHSKAMLLCRFL